MTLATPERRQALLRRGIRLEYFTIGWNVVEAIIAIAAALVASSISLLGFGIDSAVESASGVILLWRLKWEAVGNRDDVALRAVERRAEQLVGLAFLILAAYISTRAVLALVNGDRPDPSPVGLVLVVVAIGVELSLARAKRQTAADLGSRALAADAEQTRACVYLSVIVLAGIGLNALFGWWWADPVAAIGLCVLLVREGREAWVGESDDD